MPWLGANGLLPGRADFGLGPGPGLALPGAVEGLLDACGGEAVAHHVEHLERIAAQAPQAVVATRLNVLKAIELGQVVQRHAQLRGQPLDELQVAGQRFERRTGGGLSGDGRARAIAAATR